MRGLRHLVLSLGLLASLGTASGREAATFQLVNSDPALASTLGKGEWLCLKLAYRSDRPIRFRVEGYKAGQRVDDGAFHSSTQPHAAAVAGEALAWVAYREPAAIDEIRAMAWDALWRPLGTISKPVNVAWHEGPGVASRAPWVERMVQAQQEAATRRAGAPGALSQLIGLMVFLSVPAYFVLQAGTPFRFSGGWRSAAFVPLLAFVPGSLYGFAAAAHGSSIWAMLVIYFAPAASLYLVALLALHALASRPPAAQALAPRAA
jgi:hypothetical protein